MTVADEGMFQGINANSIYFKANMLDGVFNKSLYVTAILKKYSA